MLKKIKIYPSRIILEESAQIMSLIDLMGTTPFSDCITWTIILLNWAVLLYAWMKEFKGNKPH